MKTNFFKITAIVLVLAGSFGACESKYEADEPLSDEPISSNLSKNGSNSPELFTGEWDCIKFAYTVDGKAISDVKPISQGWIAMRNDSIFCEKLNNNYLFFSHLNEYYYNYSISAGLIDISLICQPTYAGVLPEEENIANALENAYSFTVKDSELIIYFTGTEKKNLLILKKR